MRPASRILVVEDDKNVRALVSRVLADDGYEVEAVATGVEAIERLDGYRPNLLVLDLVLPGLDGWGVLRHVRALPTPPPVVLLTGSAEYRTFTRAAREGVAAYMEKPFSLGALLRTCRSVLASPAGALPTLEGAERRTARRLGVRVPAEVVLGGPWQRIAAEVHDLSTGGAKLAVESSLPAESPLRLAFVAPGVDTALDLESRVQWQSPSGRGVSYGLAFVDVPDAAQGILQRALALAV